MPCDALREMCQREATRTSRRQPIPNAVVLPSPCTRGEGVGGEGPVLDRFPDYGIKRTVPLRNCIESIAAHCVEPQFQRVSIMSAISQSSALHPRNHRLEAAKSLCHLASCCKCANARQLASLHVSALCLNPLVLHKPCFSAAEIRRVRTDRMLPTKLHVTTLTISN